MRKSNSVEIKQSSADVEQKKPKGMTIAKMFRIITLPTILFAFLITVLYFVKREVFDVAGSFLTPMLCIGIAPMLAYPLGWILGRKSGKTREISRKAAFVFSGLGYLSAVMFALIATPSDEITLLIVTYFVSFCFLTALNVIGVKASGHACGIMGPLAFLCIRVNPLYFFPCAVIYALSFWSSLKLKRHTASEFIFGSLSSFIALPLSILFIIVL